MWAAHWGAIDADCDFRLVTNVNGACHYLTQYVAKQHTSLDILAIIKQKRLWTSTLKKDENTSAKWWPDGKTTEEAARWQVNHREESGSESGWTLLSGADERYALWSTPAKFPGWIEPCRGAADVIGMSGDYRFDFLRTFKSFIADMDNSIIFEEWMRERLYGKRLEGRVAVS
jgi:hypothetical protein